MLIDLFLKVVNMSIGAIPIMAVILLLRAVFKNSIPRKIFYLAWILVFLRLMVPFSLESSLSFFGFLPEQTVVEENIGTSLEFVKDEGETFDFPVLTHPSMDNPSVDFIPEESEVLFPSGTEEEVLIPIEPLPAPEAEEKAPTVTRSPIDRNLVLGIAWAFGTLALFAFGIFGYIAVSRKIKAESVAYDGNIRLSEFFKTPVVCGLVKPQIILPMNLDLDDEAKMRSVIAHECTHISRKDNLRRLLATFTLYVHWFNPLVWLCYCEFIKDMEVSCDEEVLGRSESDIRSEYAESLVSLSGEGTSPLYGGVLSFGESAIKERVKCIMNFKKAKTLIIIICCAVAVALGVIFLTNPAAPESNNSFEVTPQTMENVNYIPEKGVQLYAEIKNTGTELIYLSSGASIYYFYEGQWEPLAKFDPNGSGTVVINPGETVSFCEEITPDHFSLPTEYYKSEVKGSTQYKVMRQVYSDSECTELLGEAELEFEIIRLFEGFVATDITFLFNETDMNPMTEQKYGDKSDLEHFTALIEGLDVQNVTEFAVVSTPSDQNLRTDVETDVAIQFIRLLNGIEPKVIESENPMTGGALYIYFETADSTFYLHYDGRITLYEIGAEAGLTFGVENSEPFNEMFDFVYDLIEKIPVNPTTANEDEEKNPPAENEKPDENESSFVPAIIPTKSNHGVALPEIGEIGSVAIFNNTEKLVSPSFTPNSYGDDRVYDMFFTDVFSAVTEYENVPEHSKLGAATTGVDSVEFSRGDGKKYDVDLYENGFTLSGSAVANEDWGMYLVEKEIWNAYIKKVKEVYEDFGFNTSSWLALINSKNVTRIAVRGVNELNEYEYFPEDCEFEELASYIKNIVVAGSPRKVYSGESYNTNEDSVLVTMKFYTDTAYIIKIGRTTLTVISSDMEYDLIYDLASPGADFNFLKGYASDEVEANPLTAKPVIYLYPEKETPITAWLEFMGKVSYTYPDLDGGWRVTAMPDGTIINDRDGSSHRYLFWEGVADYDWTIKKGFVVPSKDTESFLVDALKKMGLNQYEINDFITYWVPKMIGNKYNLISFSGAEYDYVAKLTVMPQPDTVIRVHMVWKALEEPVEIEPQVLPEGKRSGFTVIEWGGTEIE